MPTPTLFAAGAFFAAVAFIPPAFVTTVVPVLVLLASLLLGSGSAAGARLVRRLGARPAGLGGTCRNDLIGLTAVGCM